MYELDFILDQESLCEFLSCAAQEPPHIMTTIIAHQMLHLVRSSSQQPWHTAFRRADAMSDFIWERLNTGHWSDVSVTWKRLYYTCMAVKVWCVLRSGLRHDLLLQDVIKLCDLALLLGSPPPQSKNFCARVATALSALLAKDLPHEDRDVPSPTQHSKRLKVQRFSAVNPVVTIDNYLSIEDFVRLYKETQTPVLVRGVLQEWPAVSGPNKWRAQYLKRVAGFRMVPVEIGRRYTDDNWTQTLMTISQFIDRFMTPQASGPSQGGGYLAQHQLFEQVPELKQDFDVPLYCYTGQGDDDDGDDDDLGITANVWFGPEGTVSPLHTDPKHNCLCQVTGKKYVLLFPPDQADSLRPHAGLLSNTSQIDFERCEEDILKEFPEFGRAQGGLDCELTEGDLLFLPAKWWHFVKSLSSSCSISFWFE